jgi:hypothetical protein
MSEAEQTLGSWCGWKAQVQWIIFSYLMGSRTRGLLACTIEPQSSILNLQLISTNSSKHLYYTLNSNSNEIHIIRNCCTYSSPWLSIHSTSLPFHSLHLHTKIYTSLINFISLYFTSSNNFTSLHFTTYFMICTTPSFRLMYHFPNLFLKLLGLQERALQNLQVTGSRAVWSYLQRNIFWYLSFVFCSENWD